MRQSVISYNESKGVYSLRNDNVTRTRKLCNARYEKPQEDHPLEVEKKNIVDTYSSSNAAAHVPEESVQLHKPKHYTIYKC